LLVTAVITASLFLGAAGVGAADVQDKMQRVVQQPQHPADGGNSGARLPLETPRREIVRVVATATPTATFAPVGEVVQPAAGTDVPAPSAEVVVINNGDLELLESEIPED
jgi:hypothetical protein